MKRLSVALALHNHQPVGNFGWVLEKIYADSYLPMVECLSRHPRIKVALHYSGFLLDWLRAHHPDFVERVAELVRRGQVEVLGGGYYEPILPSLPGRDKAAQLERLRDAVEQSFGRAPTGLWLAERVWEAALCGPLAAAGYAYTIVDDSHFERVGFRAEQLYEPFLTEDEGAPLRLLVTGTKMRYLIPWRSVAECMAYFRETASEEPRLVLMGDDGEKFGGWPTTARLCWEEGWVDRFFEALEEGSGWLETVLPGRYLAAHPARGPVYLPAGSYPEMLRWSGGFWRNFIARYPEVNAMHKKMLRVSARVAAAGSPPAAVDSLLRGQANDAYWHGVFGGVYLPHLRRAVWENLVAADRSLPGPTRVERVDYDYDGFPEILVEGLEQSVYLSPAAGGTVVEWDAAGGNVVDCIARREEPYHQRLREGSGEGGVTTGEEPVRVREPGLEKRLHYDSRRRLVFQAYLVAPGARLGSAVRSRLHEIGSFAAAPFKPGSGLAMWRSERIGRGRQAREVRMRKRFRVDQDRTAIELEVELSATGPPLDALLVVESNLGLPGGVADGDVAGLALSHPVVLGTTRRVALRQPAAGIRYQATFPGDSEAWYYPIETVNNSEAGYERIVQGACLIAVTPVALGNRARFRYRLEVTGPV